MQLGRRPGTHYQSQHTAHYHNPACHNQHRSTVRPSNHTDPADHHASETTTTRRPTAQQLADICLSAWDGNHNGFEREVKAVLNDPDSMEVHGTYFNGDDSLADGTMTLRMDYSAANAFGGMVRANALAEMDRNCDITIVAYR